jgi:hypothetical protein
LQRKFNTDGAEINTNVTFILVTTTITKQKRQQNSILLPFSSEEIIQISV